jgi:Penicillin binding protein transpeptidase domain
MSRLISEVSPGFLQNSPWGDGVGTVDGVTSEPNDPSAPDPSDSSEGPGTPKANAGAAATTPAPVLDDPVAGAAPEDPAASPPVVENLSAESSAAESAVESTAVDSFRPDLFAPTSPAPSFQPSGRQAPVAPPTAPMHAGEDEWQPSSWPPESSRPQYTGSGQPSSGYQAASWQPPGDQAVGDQLLGDQALGDYAQRSEAQHSEAQHSQAPGSEAPGSQAPGSEAPGQPSSGYQAPHHHGFGHREHGRHAAGQTVYHTSAVYGVKKEAPPKRRRSLLYAALSAAVALIVLAVLLVVVVFKPGSSTPAYGLVPNGSSAQQDGEQVAAAFLTAWESGDLTKAANYTNQPAAAQTALATYSKDLNLGAFSAGTSSVADATGSTSAQPKENVTFAVKASVAASSGNSAVRGSWTYHSTLVAYQQASSSVWFVQWQPDVEAPNLTAATHLAAVPVAPTVTLVTDADGQSLTRYNDPGLDTIAGLLKSQAPTNEGASAGLAVQIENAKGTAMTGSQAEIVAPGNYPTLSTTISAAAETAARSAVSMHNKSSMVAIQPSTGKILAIANNAGQNDFALTADVAPGSSMKVITSTALFNAGLTTANSGVACPPALTVQGITYHNDQGESEPAATPFSYDFAQSCNNAFSQWWPHLSGKLASTAKDYYGLDQSWDIGIGNLSASYFNAPASASGSELAQEAFGEGALTASPLAMASVAATVDSGTFKQPILTLNAKQVTVKSLPAATDANLKIMMRDVVTEGTAAGLGLGPTVYAKTGTADIVGQDQPNSWLVAFDPTKDIAVACLVVNAGYGAQFAGPEVSAFLKSLG